ncbi:MAG: hypothetical protein SFY56_05130 [Bacteroidota bacterium]|nr:hypothetical protein [Bacteroidota bacterium]
MTVIDLKEFEHFFKSDILKKGLQIFKNDKIILLDKNHNNVYSFSVETTKLFEISLLKKGRKILNCNCNCNSKKSVCEHICSVLFYLEKSSLDLSLKKQNFQKKYSTKSPYIKLRLEIKKVLQDYYNLKNLSIKNNNEIVGYISKIENEITYSKHDELIFLHLAIVSELPKLFSIKLISAKTSFLNLIVNSIRFIENYYSNPLKLSELDSLYQTCLQIFKNSRYLKIDYFNGILKKAISFIHDKQKISELKTYIFKIKKRPSDNLFSLDETEILKDYILLKEDFLANVFLTKNLDRLKIEYVIACFEFKINTTTKSIAFKELNSFYKIIKQKYDERIVHFLQYVLMVSKKYNNRKLEIKCICDLLIFDIEIKDELINRLKELVENNKIEFYITPIISELKTKQTYFAHLKIITLLNHFNRFDDIVSELKNLGNQFQLLHLIALKNLPKYSIDFLDYYLIHLRSAIQNTSYDYRKEQIFKSAQKYIDKLPINARNYLLDKILSYFNNSQPIYKLIKESYS